MPPTNNTSVCVRFPSQVGICIPDICKGSGKLVQEIIQSQSSLNLSEIAFVGVTGYLVPEYCGRHQNQPDESRGYLFRYAFVVATRVLLWKTLREGSPSVLKYRIIMSSVLAPGSYLEALVSGGSEESSSGSVSNALRPPSSIMKSHQAWSSTDFAQWRQQDCLPLS